MAHVVVVMGVSGTGKSTVAQSIARRVAGADVLDADDFHPPANVERMSRGIALTDAEREPWLAAMAAALRTWWMAHEHSERLLVLACSALRRAYRDRLRVIPGGAQVWVFLHGSTSLLQNHLAHRDAQGTHFMRGSMLASQLATLEPPDPATEPDVMPVTLECAVPAESLVSQIMARDPWLCRVARL